MESSSPRFEKFVNFANNGSEPFAVAFGRLVKFKRGIEGLTLEKLAIRAFQNEDKKSRISEIENAKSRNLQIKTIDALTVALNIAADELAACYPNDAQSDKNEKRDKVMTANAENGATAVNAEPGAYVSICVNLNHKQ